MPELIQQLENLVRSAQFSEVETVLNDLVVKKISRKDAYHIANIARRINKPEMALRILNPIVRPEDNLKEPATSIEKIEYAESLRRLGAVKEAWDILVNVDAEEFPQTLIHQSFCLFNQWRYKEALPLLERYVKAKELTPYLRCMGKINLAAALIYEEQLESAEILLAELKKETKQSDFQLLYGNSLELTAQLYIQKHAWDEAMALTTDSARAHQKASVLENLYSEKWHSIADSLKQNKVSTQLRQVYEKAKVAKHWETCRDCELYIARIERDSARFRHLYFGTPYQSYRQRILRLAGDDASFDTKSNFLWTSSQKPKYVFDVVTAELTGLQSAKLPIGQALHRFLILVSQDLFRPIPVLSVFAGIFPDEFVNTVTSANRVHQIVKRSREWLDGLSIKSVIDEDDGNYRLNVSDLIAFRLPAEALPIRSEELELLQLKNKYENNPFSNQQIAEQLSCSASGAHRFVKWALENDKISKFGKASRTRYQIKENKN